MGTSQCSPCGNQVEVQNKQFRQKDKIQIQSTTQITIDPNELLTNTKGTTEKKSSKYTITKFTDKKDLSAVKIQKRFRGIKTRKEFKDNIDLLNNILTLESTSTDMEQKKKIIKKNSRTRKGLPCC